MRAVKVIERDVGCRFTEVKILCHLHLLICSEFKNYLIVRLTQQFICVDNEIEYRLNAFKNAMQISGQTIGVDMP